MLVVTPTRHPSIEETGQSKRSPVVMWTHLSIWWVFVRAFILTQKASWPIRLGSEKSHVGYSVLTCVIDVLHI